MSDEHEVVKQTTKEAVIAFGEAIKGFCAAIIEDFGSIHIFDLRCQFDDWLIDHRVPGFLAEGIAYGIPDSWITWLEGKIIGLEEEDEDTADL